MEHVSPQTDADEDDSGPSERLSESVWHPWYAKLWWAAIPLFWLPASGRTGIDAVDGFYRSGIFPYASVLFLPPTAFLILAFGFLRRFFADLTWEEGPDWYLDELQRPWQCQGDQDLNHDPSDPHSGWLWVHRRMRDD